MSSETYNISLTNDNRMHELTMLYLEKTVSADVTVESLAKMYVDTYYDIYNSVNSYKRSTTHTLR